MKTNMQSNSYVHKLQLTMIDCQSVSWKLLEKEPPEQNRCVLCLLIAGLLRDLMYPHKFPFLTQEDKRRTNLVSF